MTAPTDSVDDGPQLALFSHQHQIIQRAGQYLRRGDLGEAQDLLEQWLPKFPFEFAPLVRRLELVDGWLATLPKPAAARARRLLALARTQDAPDELGRATRAMLLSAAVSAALEGGPRALLEGLPAGAHLWTVDLELARTMLEAAHAAGPEGEPWPGQACTLALLGDLAAWHGDPRAGRRLIFQALLLDPFAVLWELLHDSEVRRLPDIAVELELENHDPVAWSAAVGVVTRMLVLPALDSEPIEVDRESSAAQGKASDPRRQLRQARQFLRAMQQAVASGHSDEGLAARRTMRSLNERLFERWLGRS